MVRSMGIHLELEMTYRLHVRGPLAGNDNAKPRVQYWEMVRGSLDGPRIKATTPMPGNDWFSPLHGAFGRPHVRLPFTTDDGAAIILEYTGVVQATEAFTRAVATNGSTQWNDQYMRMALTFDTAAPRYSWLVEHLFIARGRLTGAYDLEYEVFRVR
jgi:hypothetical protein